MMYSLTNHVTNTLCAYNVILVISYNIAKFKAVGGLLTFHGLWLDQTAWHFISTMLNLSN